METGFVHLHSLLRWLVLFAGIAAVVMYALGYVNKKAFSNNENRISLIFTSLMDSQLLIGLYLYFAKGHFANLTGGSAMSNPIIRFFAVEHLFGMLVALVLVHIGRAASKKGEDATRFRKGLIYFGLALVIMLVSIPWPFTAAGVGRGWLPGMH